jgi:hypothetical protein
MSWRQPVEVFTCEIGSLSKQLMCQIILPPLQAVCNLTQLLERKPSCLDVDTEWRLPLMRTEHTVGRRPEGEQLWGLDHRLQSHLAWGERGKSKKSRNLEVGLLQVTVHRGPEDKDRGQRPEDRDRGQWPEDRDRGQRTEDRDRDPVSTQPCPVFQGEGTGLTLGQWQEYLHGNCLS